MYNVISIHLVFNILYSREFKVCDFPIFLRQRKRFSILWLFLVWKYWYWTNGTHYFKWKYLLIHFVIWYLNCGIKKKNWNKLILINAIWKFHCTKARSSYCDTIQVVSKLDCWLFRMNTKHEWYFYSWIQKVYERFFRKKAKIFCSLTPNWRELLFQMVTFDPTR